MEIEIKKSIALNLYSVYGDSVVKTHRYIKFMRIEKNILKCYCDFTPCCKLVIEFDLTDEDLIKLEAWKKMNH